MPNIIAKMSNDSFIGSKWHLEGEDKIRGKMWMVHN